MFVLRFKQFLFSDNRDDGAIEDLLVHFVARGGLALWNVLRSFPTA